MTLAPFSLTPLPGWEHQASAVDLGAWCSSEWQAVTGASLATRSKARSLQNWEYSLTS